MKRLLHCIFRFDGTDIPEECGPEVAVTHSRSLAAATSPWSDGDPPLDMARLLAYEKAIAVLHSTRTVVPLRFGCIKDDHSQILKMLDEHQAEFGQLLDRLEGLAEMGLRVWWACPPEELPQQPLSASGARYLAVARERLAALTPTEERWARRICDSLEGSYVQQEEEARPAPGGRLVSLHFLVRRAAAGAFQRRVQSLALLGGTKFLVSGPWPPYNFVQRAGS